MPLFNALMPYQGVIVATSQLRDFTLEGYLRKKIHAIELFQSAVYKLRFYSVDFERQRMFVKHGRGIAEDDEFDSKMICFREILESYKMSEDEEAETQASRHYPRDKLFPFILQT